jgi:hypothetical protein|uniref:Uncharacterized protein n=1 Tax=viral metagenome TaxID=1070528 RepID=A0A6C0IGW2_9ZZZZ
MLSELLAKYKEAKILLETQEKRVERYRKKIEDQMIAEGRDQYTDGQWTVRRQVQQRMMFTKKHVPENIWKQYAQPQKVEFVSIREAQQKK